MREETARTVANVVVGAAALGAVVVILRVPTLRRLAFGLARTAVVTGIPAWLMGAWTETSNFERRTTKEGRNTNEETTFDVRSS
jgi:hypothetical protein